MFESLFQKQPSVMKLGLSRIKKGYQALGYPGVHIPAILVGGTNGKGSTSGFLWNLFAASGVNSGLFTSPHLVNVCERIQCSHIKIDNQMLYDSWHQIMDDLPGDIYDALSFFETMTLMAFRLFETQKCQINVLVKQFFSADEITSFLPL